jgi:hypothetical protein
MQVLKKSVQISKSAGRSHIEIYDPATMQWRTCCFNQDITYALSAFDGGSLTLTATSSVAYYGPLCGDSP